jgi:hypothetical protein
MPPPEIARKLRIDVAKKASIVPPFSDHMFADALKVFRDKAVRQRLLHVTR